HCRNHSSASRTHRTYPSIVFDPSPSPIRWSRYSLHLIELERKLPEPSPARGMSLGFSLQNGTLGLRHAALMAGWADIERASSTSGSAAAISGNRGREIELR